MYCNEYFNTDKLFKSCETCRKKKYEHQRGYYRRIKEVSKNKQCKDCQELYCINWICTHKNKKYRSLTSLGIPHMSKYGIRNVIKKEKEISTRRALMNSPIALDKFKIIIVY